MKQINVGIIGFGTVGAGTYEVLTTNREIITNRVGARVVVRRIADLDIETDRGVPEKPDPEVFTTNAMDVILDPEIDVVVELMGGLDKAREFILKAMESGKHVITANKALLAEFGWEIYREAERCGVTLAFEASVGGGIPIIGALKTGLSGNRIQSCMGILNGTSNYILTKMARENLSFETAVEAAVALGFAEDPPTLDVDGTDAAHKLAIMMSIAFGGAIDFDQVFREGIVAITPDDIRFAREFGYHIKLLAIAKDLGNKLEARVHPVMIPKNHILANVHEAFNAIFLEGDFVGPTLYYGLGAGRKPTGSAVVSDIISLARDLVAEKRGMVPPLGHVHPSETAISIQPMDELITSYYFRVSALDTPGVLSTISGILAQKGISIYSVIQKGRDRKGSVPIVMLTHEARESEVREAIRLIDDLDVVTDKTVVIRVEGNNL
ncbi:MAG: homoserine dehydrogenase [Deltaproteobacteria bacterium]|nr:homoserine dehydrogenase [Deltaproteobacteria bacterium]